MPPDVNENPDPSLENYIDESKATRATVAERSPGLITARNVIRSLATLVAYTVIGINTGVAIVFSLRGHELPLNATNVHIMLCVVGFQFLMAQAILALAPDSFLSSLSLKHKRWVHWALQIMGSAIALAGCFIKIMDKEVHWTTLHGKFALVAMVFTTASLVNGVTSMYAYELRRFVPGILSRLTHILFGIIALVFASATLSYGFDKGFFRAWAWTSVADALIVLNTIVTLYIIINPCVTLYTKLSAHFRN